MAIKYAIYNNPLTEDTSDFYAVTKTNASKDFDGVVRQMMIQGSTITEADVRAVLHEAIRAIQNLLVDGQRVNFGGLVQIWPGVTGKFNDQTDSYDEERHDLTLHAKVDRSLIDSVRQEAVLEKNETGVPSPKVLQFKNVNTGETNDTLTIGGIGQLIGARLGFNENQADEGVFFIDAATQAETKVTIMQKNVAKDLVFLIPDTLTAATTYDVEVRTRVAGGQTLRSDSLEVTLSTPA
ncbi:DNA-binding domain-containing protein [Rubellicoccus peritrichatus]|uniref:DNA-binding domain-containing protein n=1 Tax=Rubellicoccus peritrichatus TaxID=3080537 RepID=A0AAQ3LBK9_9BACT|nr:DNA-binding domain-containing protein [Puniceicoccus sp. CR14]WOO41347.1 DNA-binding domain-containing protein [Puniceicoccus sp. CR14]